MQKCGSKKISKGIAGSKSENIKPTHIKNRNAIKLINHSCFINGFLYGLHEVQVTNITNVSLGFSFKIHKLCI